MSDNTEALPELPEPHQYEMGGIGGPTTPDYFTADQMRAYARAALAQQAATPTMEKAPECENECQQAVDYGVWPQHQCSAVCVYLKRQAATPAPAEPVAEHGELDPARAVATARAAIGYSAAFDGKGINWQSDEPWPHRIELAQALDWITDLGAMVLNLADRVAAQAEQSAKARYDYWHDHAAEGEALDPLERLRFFCSLAMNAQDWIDVEPFFDAVKAQAPTPAAQAEPGCISRQHGPKACAVIYCHSNNVCARAAPPATPAAPPAAQAGDAQTDSATQEGKG